MPLFAYRALDQDGEAVEGTMEETSARRVTLKLQERGFTVNSVEELHKERGLIRTAHSLTWQDLELFTEQLKAVTTGQLPMAPAFRAMAEDLQNPRLKPVLERLYLDLERGLTLEEAIARQHAAFPRIYGALIRAGEATGNLNGTVQLLCEHATRMSGLKYQLQAAFAYPGMVLLCGVVIVASLLVKVVPTFEEVFRDFNSQLPPPTMFVLWAGNTLRDHWPEIVLLFWLLVGLNFFVRWLLSRNESGRAWLDANRLRMPISGGFYYLTALVRFSRTLSVLLASRTPILDSLELAAASSGSAQLERAVNEAALDIAGGKGLAESLKDTQFFGHDFCWLLAMGEQRGDAEGALDTLGGLYERELAARDRLLGAMASPMAIIWLGMVVGFIVVGLYLPIFSLADALS